MTLRDRARRLHFLLLVGLATPALAFATFLMIEGDRSAAAMSGRAAAMGIALVSTVVAYALATTAAARLLVRVPRHSVLVHTVAPVLGALAVLVSP